MSQETRRRSYRYVGPAELRGAVRADSSGAAIRTAADLDMWIRARPPEERTEPFTYVVDAAGTLRLAPRRSEHVACAGGGRVLGAGEIGFVREAGGWAADEVSNQSTGYCPDVTSWPAVARALDGAGIARPDRFTYEVVFRRCPACDEPAIVRDGDFSCVFCGGDLPGEWNVDPGGIRRIP
ncbi:hypothetical protein FCH28_01390 [Streptomyces piniterrae]|uniref:Uncharacterized protein n=1 Tax=Streptomyces piniterrae TaxID=2571125 RepID=A0A4U0NVT8_9ACTN|nr:hypothetical protein [Streptomyces piniterrae]TJZ58841.1 hypothetical protein FCH28_01390 [Streptomyces piniterrae]